MINLIVLAVCWGIGIPVNLLAFPGNPAALRYLTAGMCFVAGLINAPYAVRWLLNK